MATQVLIPWVRGSATKRPHLCVCVCVKPCFQGILLPLEITLAGGTRLSPKRMPTKLRVIVEARSDQPGVPAFENLSVAKAVQYVVSAFRLAAVKG